MRPVPRAPRQRYHAQPMPQPSGPPGYGAAGRAARLIACCALVLAIAAVAAALARAKTDFTTPVLALPAAGDFRPGPGDGARSRAAFAWLPWPLDGNGMPAAPARR